MLQACLNGGRSRREAAAVPLTPSELAADLDACIAAGADEVHLHPRGDDGREVLNAAEISAAITALRPSGRPPGVSTWQGIVTKAGHVAALRGWAALAPGALPDYASVNLSEPEAPAIRRALADLGVGAEAGVWTVEDVARLEDGPAPYRILIEVMAQDPATALAEADDILSALDRAGAEAPRLLHGLDAGAWPLLRRAEALGLDRRIGFEDTIFSENGAPAQSNAALIAEAAGR